MSKLSIVLVVSVSLLCNGCASSARFIAEANRIPSGETLSITQSDSVLSVALDHLVLPDGPGSWVKEAVWDEYQLTFRNLSNTPVTLESVRLIDSRGIYIDRGISPDQLATMSETIMQEYKDAGIAIAITSAPTLLVFAGGVGTLATATALLPVAIIAGPAYYIGKKYTDQKDSEAIYGEFNRKTIGTLTFAPQGYV